MVRGEARRPLADFGQRGEQGRTGGSDPRRVSGDGKGAGLLRGIGKPGADDDALLGSGPQLADERGQRLVLLLQVRLDLHGLVEHGLSVRVGVLGPLVAGR